MSWGAEVGAIMGLRDRADRQEQKYEKAIASWKAENQRLEGALLLEQANRTSWETVALRLREILKEVAPEHPILQATGRIYPDGRKENGVSELLDRAFFDELESLGVKDAHAIRKPAK